MMMKELIPKNRLVPKKGRLLIAEPFLDDPYFKRSVILLCEHNKEGSLGFILNNYVDLKVSEVIKGFPDIPFRIAVGGPVNTSNLFYLHQQNDIEGARKIGDNLYLGGEFEQVMGRIQDGLLTPENIRFFIGYSGWGENQLSGEMERKSWFVTRMNPEFIMDTTNDDAWSDAVKNMGQKFSYMANFPEDPTLN